ncbi:MAG: VOC family protein [Phreatobacter sp.]
MSIHHVAITVSDPERAETAFYRCVLAALGFVRQDRTGPVTIWRNPVSDVSVDMLGAAGVQVHKPADRRAARSSTASMRNSRPPAPRSSGRRANCRSSDRPITRSSRATPMVASSSLSMPKSLYGRG